MSNQEIENVIKEWNWIIKKSVYENGFDYCIMNENNRHEFDDNFICYHCSASYDFMVGFE